MFCTVPMTNSHMKKLEVTGMKMCSGHILWETEGRDITERCSNVVLLKVMWTHEENDRIYQKTNTGEDSTWEKKRRTTEAEMDGLYQLTEWLEEENCIVLFWNNKINVLISSEIKQNLVFLISSEIKQLSSCFSFQQTPCMIIVYKLPSEISIRNV